MLVAIENFEILEILKNFKYMLIQAMDTPGLDDIATISIWI